MKKQRMYTIVMRHLSGIAKGIQAGHAIANAYAIKYGDTPEYKQWAKKDMTLIVLEAHTTDSLEKVLKKLKSKGINAAGFKEPDLGNITTAVAFLVEEDTVNLSKDPPKDPKQAFLREFVRKFNLASN